MTPLTEEDTMVLTAQQELAARKTAAHLLDMDTEVAFNTRPDDAGFFAHFDPQARGYMSVPHEYDRPKPFTWGEVVEVHRVGPYAIVEYVREPAANRLDDDLPAIRFSVFIDDVQTPGSSRGSSDIGQGTSTLDQAIVLAVAYRRDELAKPGKSFAANESPRAMRYFMRMTGDGR